MDGRSEMHRDDRPALIAFALMLLAIVAVAAIEVGFRHAATDPPAQQRTSQIENGHQQNNEESSHFLGAPVTEWMMVILTGAATAISIVAVRLLNETLKTSRTATQAAIDAVTITRAIGEGQTRPYLVFEQATFRVVRPRDKYPPFIEVEATFKNCGMTPGIISASSAAVYAPRENEGWTSRGKSWEARRIVVGANQNGTMQFRGIDASPQNTFSWFAIGILIWYDSIGGESYQDHVWLTYDGRTVRQGIDHKFALYRPDHMTEGDS